MCNISNRDCVLLIKQFNDRDFWGIPKGRMKAGETFESCAIREVFEETGVHITIKSSLPSIAFNIKNEKNPLKKIIYVFAAIPIGEEVETSSDDPECEVADAQWFPIDSLPIIQPYQKSYIKNACKK